MTIETNPILIAKKAAGFAAAELIENGMLVGLGTGSTAAFFIEALGKRCREGLKILAVATSQQSLHQAEHLGIPIKDPETTTTLDVTVDGADEIDHHKNMIKGGGGALLREKLLAQSSQEMIVIIDETKLVDHLGTHPLAVEIARFFYRSTLQRIEAKGYQGVLRLNRENVPYLTENGNYIVDLQYSTPITDPIKEQEHLKSITGVIETGLFFNLAGRVVIGYEDGFVKVRT
jgi:ribose 5-phosphate isomerase A